MKHTFNILTIRKGTVIQFDARFQYVNQGSKLTVHTAPDTHNSAVGRTIFGTVRPMCARFFSLLQTKYIEGCIGNLTGAQFKVMCAREVHK